MYDRKLLRFTSPFATAVEIEHQVADLSVLAAAPAGGRELASSNGSLPGFFRELSLLRSRTFPWRRETPGCASKQVTYRNQ